MTAYVRRTSGYISRSGRIWRFGGEYYKGRRDLCIRRISNARGASLPGDTNGKALLQIVPYFMYTSALYAIKKGKVKQAAIGFNDTDKTVGLWNNTSQIDFEQAEYEDFWDFVESSAQ